MFKNVWNYDPKDSWRNVVYPEIAEPGRLAKYHHCSCPGCREHSFGRKRHLRHRIIMEELEHAREDTECSFDVEHDQRSFLDECSGMYND